MFLGNMWNMFPRSQVVALPVNFMTVICIMTLIRNKPRCVLQARVPDVHGEPVLSRPALSLLWQ